MTKHSKNDETIELGKEFMSELAACVAQYEAVERALDDYDKLVNEIERLRAFLNKAV